MAHPWLRDLGLLAIHWLVAVGPIVLTIGLLNRRDRRRAWLLDRVAGCLPGDALRSDLAVDVRVPALAGRPAVRVDMQGCGHDQVWDVIRRLRHALPADVRVAVDGRVERRRPARITVDWLADERGPIRPVSGVSG